LNVSNILAAKHKVRPMNDLPTMNTMKLSRIALAAVVAMAAASASAADKLQYNRDIRPILADNCFACHGPDSASRQADLRLDVRDAAIEHGAIEPGKPDDSALLAHINSDDPEMLMPPPETKKHLTDAQKKTLEQWIKEGAEYQLHWSLIAPKRPELPAVRNAAWAKNPIDNFILHRLEAAGLEPAAEADKRALARRVSFDLTGLPPTPEMIAEFVSDNSPQAYEKLVDKLLASKQWGEHRGRYWLDYARYADTHGIHFDNYREMWSYRDWVIDAFNKNMPYDQFTIESLAGDLLPNRTLEQQIGSGFNRCNMTTNEGGIIDEEYLVLYTRERTDTTSQVWMGLTAGCAVCHSHKFDPLSQREFYEMAAFFNNTVQGARDGNVKDTPPIVQVPKLSDLARAEELKKLIADSKQQIDARRGAARPEFDKWLSTVTVDTAKVQVSPEKLHLSAGLTEGDGKAIKLAVDGKDRDATLADSAKWTEGPAGKALQVQGGAAEFTDVGDFEKDQPLTCSVWLNMPAAEINGAICARMDNGNRYRGWDFWVQRRQVGMHIIDAWQDNALKVVSATQIPANQWVHVTVTYDGSAKAAGVKVYHNGVEQKTAVEADALKGSIKTKVPFKIGQRNASEPFSGAMQDLRIYQRVLTPAEIESLAKGSRFDAILVKPNDQRTDAEKNELYAYWLGSFDDAFKKLSEQTAGYEREMAGLQTAGTIAHVMQERNNPAMAFILDRGEYDRRKNQVSADTPDVLPPFPKDAPKNRLGFAQWLLLPDHPLTARVTVNRCWQEVFGTGLVRTAGDFGVMGELPSHPELLDWLAVEFRESGWDVKKLYKLMVMSATYRQAAATTPMKREKDPSNRLLSRGPRFRMDAEMVRDNALAVSGLLVPKIGGPSVKPYQPDGVWEAIAMNVSNTRSYERGKGDDLYRRSMYTFVKRMAPPASMDIFNAPNREYCVVRRERTNTPLQALVTLNDDQFVEAARKLAERTLKEGGDSFETRIKFLSQRLVGRDFRADELAIIRPSLDELLTHYQGSMEDAKKLIAVGESKADPSMDAVTLAAWTMLANELLNLDEVLCK
jgi:hypothetical protein